MANHNLDFERMQNSESENLDLDHYRKLVKSYIEMHLYNAALFWADKVVSLGDNNVKDICLLAQCMYLMKQYHRAAHLLRNHGLEKKDMMCHYLTVRSLLEAKEYNDALQVINEFEMCSNVTANVNHSNDFAADIEDTPKNIQSAILYVKGRVYEAMDNRAMATTCYKQALHCDVHCFQAFEALVQNQMLSASEEKELLESLPVNEQCSDAEAELLRLLYESKLKKYQEPIENKLLFGAVNDLVLDRLSTNLDIQISEAERLYYNCDYQQCYSLTEKILKKDQYHNGCLPVHIACLVELKKTNALFYLAHKLVDLNPESAIAWFAVGCYYYIIGKSDPARRYLSKATSLDRLFGPAWLAYGHSFAVENEHDQAMAAYFKATQLMKGCHLPLLYIGLECGLTNNLKLADKFFQQAQSIAPNDPFVLHEMGVISFSNADYKTAEIQFKEAMKNIQSGLKDTIVPKKWEALLNNLGHTCRKLKKYEEALSYHQQALVLDPLNPSTYSALGFVQSLMGNAQEAVDSFHKALGLRRDDTFATTMLGYVIEQMIDDSPAFHDAPKEMPSFNKAKLLAGISESNSMNDSEPSVANEKGINKLKVKLFSGWREDTNKTEEDVVKLESSHEAVSFANNEMASEVEMLDSSAELLDASTAFIEDS